MAVGPSTAPQAAEKRVFQQPARTRRLSIQAAKNAKGTNFLSADFAD